MLRKAKLNVFIIGIFVLVQENKIQGQILEANSEFTLRSTSSVDIQVCASSVLSNERSGVQQSIAGQVQEALGSTSVYLTREYTTNTGTVCFLYVYQAPSPEIARNSGPILLTNGVVCPVQYSGFEIGCTIAAVPWQGEGYGPLGPDIPWQWTGSDVILWGGSTAGTLIFCMIGVCCFIRIAISREQKRASDILQIDKNLIGNVIDIAELEKRKKAKSTTATSKATNKISSTPTHHANTSTPTHHAISSPNK